MRFVSQFISVLFHPAFFPLYVALVVFYMTPEMVALMPQELKATLTLRLIFNGFFFPIAAILIMRGIGLIKSLVGLERNERIGILIVTMFFYIWAFASFYGEPAFDKIWSIIFLAATVVLVISFLITILFFNVSLHAAGFGLLFGLLMTLVPLAFIPMFPIIVIAVLIGGLVGTARLILNHHEPREVYTGYLTGFLGFYVAMRAMTLLIA